MKKIVLIFCFAIALLSGCSKDKSPSVSLDVYSLDLKAGDTKTVNVTSGNSNGVVWRSENEFVATVDKGKITGCHIGRTLVFANNVSVLVSVTARYNLYEEPINGVHWGMNKTDVYNLMGGKFPDKIENNVMYYYLESAVNSFKSYEFDSNDKLIAVNITVDKDYTEQLSQFFAERYTEKESANEEIYYINGVNSSSATMLISRAYYDDSYWKVSYRPIK